LQHLSAAAATVAAFAASAFAACGTWFAFAAARLEHAPKAAAGSDSATLAECSCSHRALDFPNYP